MVSKVNQHLAELNDELLNQKRVNKFYDDTIPPSGSLVHISGTFEGRQISGTFASSYHITGSSPQLVGPLAYGQLHKIVSTLNINVASNFSGGFVASRGSPFIPANESILHIPISSSSEYLSLREVDGANVEAWIFIIERI